MTQMSAGQVPGTPGSGQFRIASANLHYAGVSRSGDDSRWQASMTALRAWDPDIVLLQEMAAPAGIIAGLNARLWRTASELEMTPLLGPPGPLSVTGNHPAILVRTSRGLMILDAGPPLWGGGGGGPAPAWCQALIQVPGIGHPVAVYSVHMPARSAQEQRSQAQRLASLIAQKGEISIAGGDWNSFPRNGGALRDLHDMDPHLRPPRMHALPGPGGIELEPSYDVDDILTGVGLVDAAACLPPERRDPPALAATSSGNGRIDRFYLAPGLPDAAEQYLQADTGGSDDHHALLLILSRCAAAAIAPRDPAP